jgi:hypothetical protein
VVTGFKRLLKKPVTSGEDDLRALREGAERIKRATQEALVFHLKDFQENLKFRYFFALAEEAAQKLFLAVSQQLHAYSGDFGVLADRVHSAQADKEKALAVLGDMEGRCRRIQEDLLRLKQEISLATDR